MNKKNKIKAIIAIAVALAFFMPVAVVANDGTIGVTSDSEITSDMENMVETSTNSDTNDNALSEITSDIENMVKSTDNDNSDIIETTIDDEPIEDLVIDAEELSIVNDANNVVLTTGTTIYVNWDGTGDYLTIQEGIDAANPAGGDTVYVYNGTYNEEVTVNKQLDLVGESREGVIVSGPGSGTVFYINTPVTKVNISTFTITNGKYGIYIKSSSNCNVMNCDIYSNTYYGLYLRSSSNCNITNCNSYDNKYGTYLYYFSNNNILDCSMYNNTKYGFYLSSSSDNSITNCNASNNDYYGFYLSGSSDNNILDCSIYNNTQHGIYLSSSSNNNITNCNVYDNEANGIYLYSSSNNNITSCKVYNNTKGIYLYWAPNNKLQGNTIHDNIYNFDVLGDALQYFTQNIDLSNTVNEKPIFYIIDRENETFDGTIDDFGYLGLISCTNITAKNADTCGILLVNTAGSTISNVSSHNAIYGIHLSQSSNNNITNCDAYNNSMYGIYLYWSSNSNIIMNCDAYNNDMYGIYLYSSSDCNITNCNASNNDYYGIYLYYLSSNCNITNCDAYNNAMHGIDLEWSPNNNITNCNASNNDYYGICLADSSNSVITNCNASNNTQHGISLYYSSNSVITNCKVYDNMEYGISLYESPNNKLQGNTLHDNIYNFDIDGYTVADFTQDMMEPPLNTVNEKPIYYLVGQQNIPLDENNNFGYLGLISCTNITAKNADTCGILVIDTTDSTIFNVSSHNSGTGIYLWMGANNNITNCDAYNNRHHGIYLSGSSDNNITNCSASNNKYGQGIYLSGSSDNSITNCSAYNNNNRGIYLSGSSDNSITNCNAYNNKKYGIHLKSSSDNNMIHHNNFVNNADGNGYDACSNTWDDGSEGNYWGDYREKYPDAQELNSIWDTPYNITGKTPPNQDRYPLVLPLGDTTSPLISDVVLTTSEPLDTELGFGWENVTCTVIDLEVRDVKLMVTYLGTPFDATGYTMTKIGIDTYYYNITLTDAGNYTYHIWANDTSDNIADLSPVQTFLLPANWDMNDDRFCDISDLRMVALYFGEEGPDGWTREDYSNDGFCDISDLRMVALCFGDAY